MRILHSMLRVADLEAALEFYTRALDMRLLRRRDYPDGRFTLAFVGYQDECAAAALELTHNWDRDGYTQGDATATWPSKSGMPPSPAPGPGRWAIGSPTRPGRCSTDAA